MHSSGARQGSRFGVLLGKVWFLTASLLIAAPLEVTAQEGNPVAHEDLLPDRFSEPLSGEVAKRRRQLGPYESEDVHIVRFGTERFYLQDVAGWWPEHHTGRFSVRMLSTPRDVEYGIAAVVANRIEPLLSEAGMLAHVRSLERRFPDAVRLIETAFRSVPVPALDGRTVPFAEALFRLDANGTESAEGRLFVYQVVVRQEDLLLLFSQVGPWRKIDPLRERMRREAIHLLPVEGAVASVRTDVP